MLADIPRCYSGYDLFFYTLLVPKKFTVALIKPDVVENGQVDEIIAKVS